MNNAIKHIFDPSPLVRWASLCRAVSGQKKSRKWQVNYIYRFHGLKNFKFYLSTLSLLCLKTNSYLYDESLVSLRPSGLQVFRANFFYFTLHCFNDNDPDAHSFCLTRHSFIHCGVWYSVSFITSTYRLYFQKLYMSILFIGIFPMKNYYTIIYNLSCRKSEKAFRSIKIITGTLNKT